MAPAPRPVTLLFRKTSPARARPAPQLGLRRRPRERGWSLATCKGRPSRKHLPGLRPSMAPCYATTGRRLTTSCARARATLLSLNVAINRGPRGTKTKGI